MIPVKNAHLQVFADTHPGMKGKNNEDEYSVSAHNLSSTDSTPSLFAVVADGIGGHLAGEVAAQIAVEMISQAVAESDASQPTGIMQAAILQASQAILAQSGTDSKKQGMGSTVVCAWVIGDRLFTASVGDSRLYLIRGSQMYQLTVDHTWVQEAVDAGALTDEQARSHPHANIIRRHLGSSKKLEVDLRIRTDKRTKHSKRNQGMRLNPGDRLILCSDGLNDMVEDKDIQRIAEADELDGVVPALIEAANGAGGKDNITVIVIEVPKSKFGLSLPRLNLSDRKTQAALSYIGFGIIAMIIIAALVIYGLRAISSGPDPTPTSTVTPTNTPTNTATCG